MKRTKIKIKVATKYSMFKIRSLTVSNELYNKHNKNFGKKEGEVSKLYFSPKIGVYYVCQIIQPALKNSLLFLRYLKVSVLKDLIIFENIDEYEKHKYIEKCQFEIKEKNFQMDLDIYHSIFNQRVLDRKKDKRYYLNEDNSFFLQENLESSIPITEKEYLCKLKSNNTQKK